jgi:hypothetical protein
VSVEEERTSIVLAEYCPLLRLHYGGELEEVANKKYLHTTER